METSALRADEAPAWSAAPFPAIGSDYCFSSTDEIDLRELVGHSAAVEASTTIEDVSRALLTRRQTSSRSSTLGPLIGMCSRHELGALLGSRYGFSLWARDPIREHLRKNEIRISLGDAIGAVLATVFARADELFYDDVLLVDDAGSSSVIRPPDLHVSCASVY